MEYAFSILMFCFAGCILLYSGLVVIFGSEFIPKKWAAKITDEKAYAKRFAKILALTALAPVLAGAAGLLVDINRNPFVPLLILVLGTAAAIYFGLRLD